MIPKTTVDAGGNQIKVWKFNITRYVQNYLNGREPLYNFRLSSPYLLKELFRIGTSDVDQYFTINSDILAGRVRIGGGNHATQRMRLRIIYSKL